MKKIFFIPCLLVLIIACADDIEETGYLPPSPCNVTFLPTIVSRGDIVTIKYDMVFLEKSLEFTDLTVDENGVLKYIGDNTEVMDFNNKTDKEKNSLVEFGIKILEGAQESYFIQPDGNYSLGYEYKYYQKREIYPEKYLKFVKYEIECIVPDGAVSGPVKLNFGTSDLGFSEDALIIVDASGDEIW